VRTARACLRPMGCAARGPLTRVAFALPHPEGAPPGAASRQWQVAAAAGHR
jgi:hypothetical protein